MSILKKMSVVEILLVEDNPGDSRLVQEVLQNSKINNNLYIVSDGEEALSFIRKEGKYSSKPSPNLILLDLNLPKKDGREVLQELKTNEEYKKIPIIVLTTSKSEDDINKTYNLHVNSYLTKPVDLDDFNNLVKSIEDFWMVHAQLPKLN